jgi:sugar phosphate isomerase/epimerase
MDNTSYATVGFSDRDVEGALDAIAAAGFPQAELMGRGPHISEPLTGQALLAFRKRVEGRGLRARSVHAPTMETVLGAPDEDWRREKVELLKTYIRFASEVGATGIVMHPVPNPIFVPNADDPAIPDRIRDAARRSLDDLAPVAGSYGVHIMLENLPYECDYPYLTMQELRPLVDGYPEDSVGLVIDTGHVGLMGMDVPGEIRTAGSRLRGTHLHDVDFDVPDGDHRAPTQGGFDWDAIRRALSDISYPGAWTFEVIVPSHGESPEELARITREAATSWGL